MYLKLPQQRASHESLAGNEDRQDRQAGGKERHRIGSGERGCINSGGPGNMDMSGNPD